MRLKAWTVSHLLKNCYCGLKTGGRDRIVPPASKDLNQLLQSQIPITNGESAKSSTRKWLAVRGTIGWNGRTRGCPNLNWLEPRSWWMRSWRMTEAGPEVGSGL